MADISICPAIRMPPSFRGVSSVAFGAVPVVRQATTPWPTVRCLPDITSCPWPDSNRQPLPRYWGRSILLSYKDIYPSSGYVAGSTAFPACRGSSPFRVKETETAPPSSCG